VLLLGLDTATPRVTVGIGSGGSLLGEVRLTGGRRHAEQLAPAIRYLCDELGIDLGQLSGIAIGLGPGLFTGLRVGVTTAKVMGEALRVPVVGVPSLDLLAYPLRHTNRLVVPVLDARRREVFHARYRAVPGGVQRVSGYEVGPASDLIAELEASGEEVLLAGDGVDAYAAQFESLERAEYAGPAFESPGAAALVELATARFEREEFEAPRDIHPLYLRRSDAEIEWERMAS
jgi:tRNA threonylcarbamoyladenosine biosynthesis protein TsaB